MLLVTLYAGEFITYVGMSIIGPIFPVEAKKYRGISEFWIGFIFAIHPFFAFIASLILGKVM
jgi:hypothetical protein